MGGRRWGGKNHIYGPAPFHWDFPGGPVVKTLLPLGVWSRSLVRELKIVHAMWCDHKKFIVKNFLSFVDRH